jgi:hypothetical protein
VVERRDKSPGKIVDNFTCPSVSHSYRRDGFRQSTVDAAGLHSFTQTIQPGAGSGGTVAVTETVTAGSTGYLAGLSLQKTWSDAGQSFSVTAPVSEPSSFYDVSHVANGAGKLETVTDDITDHTFAYQWKAHNGQLERVTSLLDGGAPGASQPLHQHFERLLSKGGRLTAQFYTRGSLSWNPNSRVMGWRYTLRPDGNRGAVSPYTAEGQVPLEADPPGWAWSYNARGEVTGAARHRPPSAGAAPAHQAWGYSYDAMGNRLAAVRGSSASPQPALTTSYQANALNQLSAVTTPRGLEFSGKEMRYNKLSFGPRPA